MLILRCHCRKVKDKYFGCFFFFVFLKYIRNIKIEAFIRQALQWRKNTACVSEDMYGILSFLFSGLLAHSRVFNLIDRSDIELDNE